MKMLKSLLSVRFAGILSSLFRLSNKKGQKSSAKTATTVGMSLLFIYVIAVFLFMFGAMFNSLVTPLHQAGLDWFYFAYVIIVSFAMMFILNTFLAQSVIFEAKDNESLLSLPVPVPVILFSRVLILILTNLGYGLFVCVPAVVVYLMNGYALSAVSIIILILTMLLLCLFATALSCLLGALLSALTSRMRSKTLFTVILSLAFLGAYFYFYSQIYSYLQLLIANSVTVASAVQNAALPVYWMGNSIAESNIMQFLPAALCLIIPFAVVYAILSVSFLKIATSKRGAEKLKYKEKSLAVSSAGTALLKKELAHFWATPGYVLNGALGSFFLVGGSIFVLFKRDIVSSLFTTVPNLDKYTGVMLALALSTLIATNILSAPSVSLEGKNLWISKSCPVDTFTILKSKVMLHLSLTVPAIIISGIILSFVISISAAELVLAILCSVLITMVFAMFGLMVNLFLPKFNWVNETMCIKNSGSSVISMFSNWILVAIPALLYGLTPLIKIISPTVYLLIWSAVFAVIVILLYLWLKKFGTKRFDALG